MADPKTIHLVFKTHLDIGFTEHAEKVRRLYHERFIPQAIETGAHFFAENPADPKFVWTTGAWLIWDHLTTRSPAEVRRLEAAISNGLIRWHGLPFTTHSELMSPALFRAGLSFSQELDRRFGTTTIGAKMTDVPGHALGIVPLIAEAGLKFLHLGVNTACPPPDVPDLFRWRAPDGSEVVVMYQRSYGATEFPLGTGDGLGFAHTNDNMGPQSIHQTVEVYRALAHAHPDAAIRAATLDDFAAIAWAARDSLPMVTTDLGDSWIHGSASDPQKTARYLALQRVYDRFAREGLTPARTAFGRGLTLVAEHTWGVDVKTFLRDETAWDRPAFEAARKTDFRFSYAEASWREQRAYLDAALDHLDEADRAEADAALAPMSPPAPPAVADPAGSMPELRVGGWTLGLSPATGDITTLVAPDGTRLGGRDGVLMGYRYESYDAGDVARHMDTYLTDRPEWAILDHAKPGLERAASARSARLAPMLTGVADMDGVAYAAMALEDVAHRELGAPARVDWRVTPHKDGIEIAVILYDKPANRMPEASFVGFTPAGAEAWDFERVGLWGPADAVAAHGGGQLQAVSAARTRLADGRNFQIRPLDTPLAAPFAWPFLTYDPGVPDFSKGLRFNLHNNKWGTNFPMWSEGTIVARFEISLA